MAVALPRTDEFERDACINCGVEFYWPLSLRNQRLKDGQSFHCPNGHGQSWRKTEVDKLKEQLALSEKERVAAVANLWKEVERSANLQRQLKRVKKGVCPCCRRSFENLGKHMKGKHPDFLDKAKEKQ